MGVERLPDSTVALATELRERALALDAELAALPAGTPVSKIVSGRPYWYLQSRGGGLETQRYLGPETEELRQRLATWARLRESLAPELAELERLNEMVVAGGVAREPAVATRGLELLAAGGFFRAGAVLVGTRAFGAYGPLLGFRAPLAARTQDIDVALGRSIDLALPRGEGGELSTPFAGTEPPFLPVPELDPRRPSTSFKLRGRELRIDFLTPRRRGEGERPVAIPALRAAAWPLELLDFLLDGSIHAVVVGTRPVLVRVPDPVRFALHKLWLCGERSSQETARARKDFAQAETLLELMVDEGRRALASGGNALLRRPRAAARARAQARRLSPDLAAIVLGALKP